MFEVLLIRHGVPLCDHRTKIRGCDFASWAAAYESAPVDRSIPPPPELQKRLATIPCIVISTLRRSIESALLLAPERPTTSNPLFNEAGILTAIPFRLRLTPGQWDVFARAMWILGFAAGAESFRAARARATRAGNHLAGLAREHGGVALVGHGMLNTLIGRYLRRSGWTGTGSPRAYWGSVALRNNATESGAFVVEPRCTPPPGLSPPPNWRNDSSMPRSQM